MLKALRMGRKLLATIFNILRLAGVPSESAWMLGVWSLTGRAWQFGGGWTSQRPSPCSLSKCLINASLDKCYASASRCQSSMSTSVLVLHWPATLKGMVTMRAPLIEHAQIMIKWHLYGPSNQMHAQKVQKNVLETSLKPSYHSTALYKMERIYIQTKVISWVSDELHVLIGNNTLPFLTHPGLNFYDGFFVHSWVC